MIVSALRLLIVAISFIGSSSESYAQSSVQPGARIVVDTSAVGPSVVSTLTTDIFWCAGDEKAQSRALTASELAASFGVLVKLDASSPRLPPIVIRTRSLDKETLINKLDKTSLDMAVNKILVSYDTKDPASENFISRIVMSSLRPAGAFSIAVTPTASVAFTPNYVSIFVCTEIDASAIAGRLFFQVADQKQVEGIWLAASELRKELPGLNVVRQVEVVGAKAPSKSELRYFFDEDEKLASRAADALSTATSGHINVKLVTGFENKVRRGTFEAWIAK